MDYETAKRLNPGIVYLYAGAYGSTGPHSHRTGFHPIAAAITGGPRYQLGRDLPTPPNVPLDLGGVHAMSDILRRANESNPDPVAALANCAAILMGLYHRARTGEGQHIETSMLSANLYANADDAVQYEGKPERPLADADFNGLSAVYRIYRCREGWVFLACPQDDEWAALAGALGGPLADPASPPRRAGGNATPASPPSSSPSSPKPAPRSGSAASSPPASLASGSPTSTADAS